jgi:hypothetical protein
MPQPNDPYDPQPPQPGTQLPPVPVNNQLPQQQQAAPPDPRTIRLEQELAEQRRLTNNLANVLNRNQPQNNQPSREDMNRQFFQDPITSTQAIAQQAVREVTQQFGESHMDTLIALARDRVRAQDPELFDRYLPEIEGRVALAGPQFRTNINVWESAFNMVKGAHLNELRDQVRQQQPQAPAIHVSREGGPAQPNVPQGPAPREVALSDEEKKMAKKLGITEDMYRTGKQQNDNQTDLEFAPLGPSSWDKVITFDSKEKRRSERERNRNARPNAA